MKPLKTVKTLYKKSLQEEVNLFPSFNTEWWNTIYNSDTYEGVDNLFARLYSSYMFYSSMRDLHDDYDDATALNDFKLAVKTMFMMNDKKYSELFRLEDIADDDAYNLTNNYDMHESYSGTNATQGSAITGQRTDVSYDNTGSQTIEGLNKVTGWNSGSENTDNSNTSSVGNREDTHQFTKGQEQDTSRTQGQDSHTLRRYGNIGVQTVDSILQGHLWWKEWSFLKIIFDDICSEFLLIGDDYIWH